MINAIATGSNSVLGREIFKAKRTTNISPAALYHMERKNMKFHIEQIAISPTEPDKARELLEAMGAVDWIEDKVEAEGSCFTEDTKNQANLSFNYQLLEKANEFEILEYTEGDNWIGQSLKSGIVNVDIGYSDYAIANRANTVCNLGMHCTEWELNQWRVFFLKRDIEVVQEVLTTSHTNKAVKGKRAYNYVIFDTKSILGVDLKFIVRIDKAVELTLKTL